MLPLARPVRRASELQSAHTVERIDFRRHSVQCVCLAQGA